MLTAWEKVTSETRLISLPDIYIQLKAVLDNPDYVLADIEAVIEKDPAISARLLRMVNSAYFGLAVEISTINRAINLLGTQQIHDLVLASSVSETFAGIPEDIMSMQQFWRQSVYCAAASRVLASACNVLDSDRLFVAGLLRDIGHLVMYQAIPDICLQILEAAKEREMPLAEMERNFVGFDYAMVGGELMHQWNLPKSLQEPTFYHLEPEKAANYPLETAIIHIAAKMTDAYAADEVVATGLAQVDDAALQTTGLNEDQCQAADEEAKAEIEAIMSLIFSAKQFKTSA